MVHSIVSLWRSLSSLTASKRVAAVLLLGCATCGFAQVYSSGGPVVDSSGTPYPQGAVAVCTSSSSTAPCVGSSLATIYTDVSISVACTNNPTILGPLSGVGCTNPGKTDAHGNYTIYAPGTNVLYAQMYGSLVNTTSFPFQTSLSFTSVFASPPPIGNVAPNTGAFTTLSANLFRGVYDAAQQTGADMCAKINAIVVAHPGSVIDARTFTGNQACASNPFASQTGDETLYLGEGLVIQTTAPWITNSSFNTLIYGAGRGSSSRGTIIQATGTWPTSCDGLGTGCAILRLGDGSGPVFGTRFENGTLDCNGKTDCIGMYSTDLQEQTGMRDFQVINYSFIGILVDGSSNAGTGPFWSQNYELRDGEVYALTFGTGSTIGLKLIGGNNSAGGETAPRIIEHITAGGNSGHAIGTAFQMEQWWGGFIRDLNAENATTGYQFGISKPMNGVMGSNLRCANVATNCVWITSNSPFSNNITLMGIQNTPSVATNTIKDDQQSVNTLGSTDVTVGLYILGQGYSAGGITNINTSSVTGSFQIPSFTEYNGADTAATFFMNSGKTAAQGQVIQMQDRGTNKYAVQNTSSNAFQIFDNANNIGRFILNSPNGLTNLNSFSTGAVAINANTNSGTGGFQVWSGGATPTDNFVVSSTGSLSFGGGQTLTTSNAVPTFSATTTNHAACIKAPGPPVQLGSCSTVVAADGSCTCN